MNNSCIIYNDLFSKKLELLLYIHIHNYFLIYGSFLYVMYFFVYLTFSNHGEYIIHQTVFIQWLIFRNCYESVREVIDKYTMIDLLFLMCFSFEFHFTEQHIDWRNIIKQWKYNLPCGLASSNCCCRPHHWNIFECVVELYAIAQLHSQPCQVLPR